MIHGQKVKDNEMIILARFLLFFYSIDIDRLEVDLGYICDRDPNLSKSVTVELE